jgi:hypothetical protein
MKCDTKNCSIAKTWKFGPRECLACDCEGNCGYVADIVLFPAAFFKSEGSD